MIVKLRNKNSILQYTLVLFFIIQSSAFGIPSLHQKVYELKEKSVHKMIKKGSDVNKRDSDGKTPLFYCLYNEAESKTKIQKRIAVLLLKNGAEVNVQDSRGNSPLHHALQYENIALASILIAKGADCTLKDNFGVTSLHIASGIGNISLMKKIMKRGANINARDAGKWTPLHEAVNNNNTEAALLLLENGAESNAKNEELNTPLHLGVRNGSAAIIKALIRKNALVNAENIIGNTPIFNAMRSGRRENAQILIDNRALLTVRNKSGLGPIHEAAYYGAPKIIDLLLKNGADINSYTDLNYTPLHIAVAKGDAHLVRLLIKKGADINAASSKERNSTTPLHLAFRKKNSDIAWHLLYHGADFNRRDAKGKRAFDYLPAGEDTDLSIIFNAYEGNGAPFSFLPSKTGKNDKIFSTSFYRSRHNSKKYRPQNVFDRKLRTSWVEGKRGDGIGEKLAFYTDRPYKRIKIFPGFGRKRYFRNKNRIKKAILYIYEAYHKGDEKSRYSFSIGRPVLCKVLQFKDRWKSHYFDLPFDGKKNQNFLYILEIKEVYRGRRFRHTCIAEIKLLNK